MKRVALLVFLFASGVRASEAPDFHKNAFTFGLDYGYGLWQVDQAHLNAQVPVFGVQFVGELQNTQAATVRIGFEILGYATVEADLTGTGWNIFSSNRGGGGFIVGAASWHPMRLFLDSPDRPYDASLFVGLGYGITGQTFGMDGFVTEMGLRGSYFFNRWFGLTASARWMFPSWNTFYTDFNNRVSVPASRGLGGDFFTIALGIELRLVP